MDRKWLENLVGRAKHESAGAGMKNRARVFSVFQGHGRVVRSCGKQNMMEETNTARGRYWQANLRCVGVLLSIWFFVSYGCGILLRDWLDANFPKIGTAPFGFWMAQQGAIICFVLLLISYAFWMKKLDAQFEVDEEEGR